MIVEFVDLASLELFDAIDFYNIQSTGLGDNFFNEVLEMIGLITRYPNAWTKNTKNTRKATLKKFPYKLIYTILNNKIYILAVAHQHRKPDYWIERDLR